MQAGYLRIAERSVRAGCEAKGISLGTPMEGEEWATGPWSVVRHLRLVAESLDALARTGNTPIGPIQRAIDGRLIARVFPANRVDGVLFSGITAHVRFQEGVDEERMHATRAGFYKDARHTGRTVLILGAGNIAAIPAMDVITKLFNEGKVCLLKLSPVNAYLAPFLEEAFEEPIRRGFLAVERGGSEEGGYLSHHPGIDEVHLTGSDSTYDQVVWGPKGPERESRKVRNAPLLGKPVTAELGNVSPVLFMPGPYSDGELAFQAESIVGAVTMNASFLCNSPKMLITPKGWSARGRLMAALERAFALAPVRSAYYPGSEKKYRYTHRRTCLDPNNRRRGSGSTSLDDRAWSRCHRLARAGIQSWNRSARSCSRQRWEAMILWSFWIARSISPTTVCGERCRPIW